MKTNEEKFEDSMRFVVAHFEKGVFIRHKAWDKIMEKNRFNWRRMLAAASIACAILAASAFIYTSLSPSLHKDAGIIDNIETDPSLTVDGSVSTAKLEFKDAPLSDVVREIETTYGVSISGLPENEPTLTLSYEGSASELVETINDVLNTSLVIEDDIPEETFKDKSK